MNKIKHIIFMPGKNPKPPEETHRGMLWRSLLRGVQQASPEVAQLMERQPETFSLIAWNYLYYGRYKNTDEDLPCLEQLFRKDGASEEDKKAISGMHRRLAFLLYRVIDLFPFLINVSPDPAVKATVKETERYFHNQQGIACKIREPLKQKLCEIFDADEEVLLIGHSMGSVIAYDALWELTHLDHHPGKVSLFLTLGSPLGMQYAQKRLLGAEANGARRYPGNIKHWLNISAQGDLTTLNASVKDGFAEMLRLGLIDSIEDKNKGVFNYFRNDKGLNVHRSYGYLVNRVVGEVIAQWCLSKHDVVEQKRGVGIA